MAKKKQRERAEVHIDAAFKAQNTLIESVRKASRLLGDPRFEAGSTDAHDAICHADAHDMTNFLLKLRSFAMGDAYHDEED